MRPLLDNGSVAVDPARMALAVALRDEIDRRALSQTEAAERLGVQQQTVSRWTTGREVPRPEHLAALASFLRLPVTQVREMRAAARRSSQDRRLDAIESRLDSIEEILKRLAERRR